MPKTPRKKREGARYLFLERPRCPECGSTRLRTYRSVEQEDGTRLRYSECLTCGCRLRIVLE